MSLRVSTITITAVLIGSLVAPASAAPTQPDLTTWTAHHQPHTGIGAPADGSWVVDALGVEVDQTVNGRPTWFSSSQNAEGYRITASVTTPSFDDDFFGFALGFSDPSQATTDYLLVDWKQSDQTIDWGAGTGPVTGTAGLAVSRVSGIPTLNEIWGHTDSAANPSGSVVELARATTLGATGWATATSYDFVIEYTLESLDVWVEGSHEISISGDFPSGAFALYDFSQPDTSFSEITFEHLNQPPQVVDSGADDVSVNEGSLGATSGSFSDPNGDELLLTCSGSCVGFSDDGSGSWSWSQVLPEGPSTFTVTVTASDGEFEASDNFEVVVINVSPVITSTSSLPSYQPDDQNLAVTADFTDVGVLDTHTAQFSWGDGSSSPGIVTETNGSGSAEGSHLYAQPGTYTISVTVWDDDGAWDTATVGQVFVYDPDDFVTGGGWVQSPIGASTENPDHTGKLTFGFVARYGQTGDTAGSFQANLHQGLNIHASSIDYLAISGGIAEFGGTARVNGVPGYTFDVVAIDERSAPTDSDKFWLQIHTAGGDLLYGGAAYPIGLDIVGKGIQVHDR